FEAVAAETGSDYASTAWANAGIAWLKLREPAAAWERLEAALAREGGLKDRPIYMLYAAEVLFRLQRYEASIGMFETLVQMAGTETFDAEIIRGLAWNYYAMKQWDRAAEYFTQSAHRFPDSEHHAESLLRTAECLFNMGQYERAKVGFAALIDGYPLHPEAFEARLLNARADWVRGDVTSGLAGLEEALRYAPDPETRQRVRLTLGDWYQEQARYAEAMDQFRQAYLEAPHSGMAPATLLKQADNLYNMEMYTESADVYRTVIRQFPDHALAGDAQYAIGLIYFRQGRLDDYFDECLQTADRYPGTRHGALALQGASALLIEQNRFDEATRLLRRLLTDYGNHVDRQMIMFRLGETLMGSGRVEEAEPIFRDLLADAPRGRFGADASLVLAEIIWAREEPDQAIALVMDVVENFPTHPRRGEAQRKAADMMADRGNWREAERLWVAFIADQPEAPDVGDAHIALAGILVTQNRLEEAREHVEWAVAQKDRRVIASGRIFESIILEKQGNTDDALKGYLKIGYVFPDQHDIMLEAWLRAAGILRSQGKVAQADRMLEKAEELADTASRRQRLQIVMRELGLSGGAE
ncbi:tetratricopeptide repeat protein, partial [bacterium]|nr:tetratricopeptide repeat protein [candidate division CSSED10-310 bacterium]